MRELYTNFFQDFPLHLFDILYQFFIPERSVEILFVSDISVKILNAYHPVDYGFEINITAHQTGQTEMLHSVLMEQQDIEQSIWKKRQKF